MMPFETKGGVVSFDDCITQAAEKLREASELLLRAGHLENSHNRTERGQNGHLANGMFASYAR